MQQIEGEGLNGEWLAASHQAAHRPRQAQPGRTRSIFKPACRAPCAAAQALCSPFSLSSTILRLAGSWEAWVQASLCGAGGVQLQTFRASIVLRGCIENS